MESIVLYVWARRVKCNHTAKDEATAKEAAVSLKPGVVNLAGSGWVPPTHRETPVFRVARVLNWWE